MLHILMGRAGTGKSRRVLEEIAALGDGGRQILLVPEHASHMAEVDVCRVCGDGASRHAEVLTFKLLASRVLALTGGSADVTLDNGGKLLTLQCVLQELSPVLRVYRQPSRRAAFLTGLLAVLEELQAYAVVPETLAERVGTVEGESGDKLRDIALIYGEYLARLYDGEHDARDRLEKLEEGLEPSGYLDGKDVFLDGFSYFTGRELRILAVALRRAKRVTVTLTGDPDDPELFHESLRVREGLIALADDRGIPFTVEVLQSAKPGSALAHAERHFFGARAEWTGESASVRLYEAGTAETEAEWTAAQILRLVREEGYRFHEITVMARNAAAYWSLLEAVFARCGVPLYGSRRSDILRQPMVSLLLGALDAATGGFEYEDVFRCLKTGLAGLSAEECDLLENYVHKWDIRGAAWTRDADWTAHPEGYGVEWTDAARERLARVNALRARLQPPFSRLADGLRGQTGARDKTRALYAFLEDLRLAETLQAQTEHLFAGGEGQRAEETAQLWAILCGVMDQFVSILGDRTLDAEEFARLFRQILTQYSVGSIPAALDQVSCSEMTRSDRHPARALFLLGALDGVLPEIEQRGGVLREEDRLALEALNIHLAPHGLSQFRLELQNLYAALAKPLERLIVSYPRFDERGAEQQPSFVVGRLQALFPALELERESAGREYRLESRQTALSCAGEYIGGALWRYFERDPSCAPVLDAMASAARYARGRLSNETARTLYGQRVTLSATRIDRARSCHFAYFMQFGLRAKEREKAAFDAPQAGTFLHDVMERTLRLAEEAGGVKTLTPDALHALTRRAIDEYIARRLPELDVKPARFRFLFRRLCDAAERVMDDVAEELKTSDFVPLAFELSFGTGEGAYPPITIRAGGQELRVVGRVDRVDGWLHDGKLYLRVADYKTGKKSFDLAELRYGLGMQMLLYLFALQRGKQLFDGETVPAGVLYIPARDVIARVRRGADEAAVEKELRKNLCRSGLLLSDPEALRAMDSRLPESSDYLPVTRKKDGTLGGSLATLEQFGKLGRYLDHLLGEIARDMAQGNIDADPYARGPQDTACTYCPFLPACQFEEGRGGDRFEIIPSTKPEAFWRAVDETLVTVQTPSGRLN